MSIRKILAIKVRAMGDTVIMTAALAELRRAYPTAEIHALVDHRWASLLDGSPFVNKVLELERKATRIGRAQAVALLGFQLRSERYDAVINFHAGTSTALLARLTGAPVRSIHFHALTGKNLFSTVEVPEKGVVKPIIERDMDAVRALGLEIPKGVYPHIPVSESQRLRSAELLRELGLRGPILGLGLGASRPAKSWSISRFAELASGWCAEKSGSVLALAGANEHPLLQAFESASPAALNNRIRGIANLKLAELPGVIQQFSVFAGNDSGPRHLAVAVGIPTVTLFGPEHPYEWHPYRTEEHPYFFTEDLNCRTSAVESQRPWCGLQECPDNHHCMSSIDVAPVLRECLRIAKETP